MVYTTHDTANLPQHDTFLNEVGGGGRGMEEVGPHPGELTQQPGPRHVKRVPKALRSDTLCEGTREKANKEQKFSFSFS